MSKEGSFSICGRGAEMWCFHARPYLLETPASFGGWVPEILTYGGWGVVENRDTMQSFLKSVPRAMSSHLGPMNKLFLIEINR